MIAHRGHRIANAAYPFSHTAFTPLLIISLFTAFAGFAPQSLADDWPRWRGPELTGISKETGWTTNWPKEGPKQLWSSSVGVGFSSVSVADGRLFTMGNRDGMDTVFCLEAETGTELWRHSYPCELDPIYYEGGPGSTPTIDGDNVFILSKRGHAICFSGADGGVVWQKNLTNEIGVTKPRWGFAGSPLVEGDLLLLNAGESGTAIDKRSGKIVWTSATNAAGYASPVPVTIDNEKCVLIFSGKSLFAVKPGTGQPIWKRDWETKWDINAADPIVLGDRLFLSSFDRGCALIRFGTHETSAIWENKNMGNHFNSCVLWNGYFYGVDGNTDQARKELRCIDSASGAVKWSTPGFGMGSVTAADGKLIILSEHGELVIAEANPESFKPIARAQVMGGKCWTVPVLANGRIYCRNAKGSLVCLDVRGK
ncbi:MAG: PQQ-like beta-propeller repeat protein [Verrucomicrobia bacterium]|nr:PQQ-like beta-propeller repeat protein [Verrucomicrobiota bacterium]